MQPANLSVQVHVSFFLLHALFRMLFTIRFEVHIFFCFSVCFCVVMNGNLGYSMFPRKLNAFRLQYVRPLCCATVQADGCSLVQLLCFMPTA